MNEGDVEKGTGAHRDFIEHRRVTDSTGSSNRYIFILKHTVINYSMCLRENI